jgi:hypothetical protein
MYTCIHRGAPGAAAATSSSEQLASEDSTISAPTAAAPRAVAVSPSPWASRCTAVGAMTTGELTAVPSNVVDRSTPAMPASTLGWSCQRAHASIFPAKSRSSSAPPAK